MGYFSFILMQKVHGNIYYCVTFCFVSLFIFGKSSNQTLTVTLRSALEIIKTSIKISGALAAEIFQRRP